MQKQFGKSVNRKYSNEKSIIVCFQLELLTKQTHTHTHKFTNETNPYMLLECEDTLLFLSWIKKNVKSFIKKFKEWNKNLMNGIIKKTKNKFINFR